VKRWERVHDAPAGEQQRAVVDAGQHDEPEHRTDEQSGGDRGDAEERRGRYTERGEHAEVQHGVGGDEPQAGRVIAADHGVGESRRRRERLARGEVHTEEPDRDDQPGEQAADGAVYDCARL
jgi:hypothetical protein